jgi:sec-independent protein translocase protein TatA
VILVIVLVLFGPKQIPKLSRMFGRAMKDLREGMEGKDEDEIEPSKPAEIPQAKVPGQSETEAESKKSEETTV